MDIPISYILMYGKLGAKVPPMQDRPPHPYPHPERFQNIVPSYSAGPLPTLPPVPRHPPQMPVGPPPIPAFTQSQPCNHLPSAIHWNPYNQQECRSQWAGPPSHGSQPHHQTYYPPTGYHRSTSRDRGSDSNRGRDPPSNFVPFVAPIDHSSSRDYGWDTNRGRVPPPGFVPFGATDRINQSQATYHPVPPPNRFPPQPHPTASTGADFPSSSTGTRNLHHSDPHRPPTETERDATSARFSRHAGRDRSEERGRHEPTDSRLNTRPLKSILRTSSSRVPQTRTVTNEDIPPPSASSKAKGKSKATSVSNDDTTRTRSTETTAGPVPSSSTQTQRISETQKRADVTAIIQGSGVQGDVDPFDRPPTPGTIMRDPAFDDQLAPKRNRHPHRLNPADKVSTSKRTEPSSKLQKPVKNQVKPKLIDLLTHNSSREYPALEWDVTLSVYRVKKWLSRRHCVPLCKADLRLGAIEPPVKEVFIFTTKFGTPLSLVFDQWGPIHIQTRTGETSLTIEDILLGIHSYFSKPLTHSEMLDLDDTMTARVVDSRNKRWILAGKTDPDRADVIASTDPLRADELCGCLSFAGLTMDSDFVKSRTLYLTLESPSIKQKQGGLSYF